MSVRDAGRFRKPEGLSCAPKRPWQTSVRVFRATNAPRKLPVTVRPLWIAVQSLRMAVCPLWIAVQRLRTAVRPLWIAVQRLRMAVCPLWIAVQRLRTAVCRRSGSRFRGCERRLSALDRGSEAANGGCVRSGSRFRGCERRFAPLCDRGSEAAIAIRALRDAVRRWQQPLPEPAAGGLRAPGREECHRIFSPGARETQTVRSQFGETP